MARDPKLQAAIDKIAAADVSETGIPITDGKYELLLKKVFLGDKRKGLIFIVDFEVVKAIKTDPNVEPNPVGSPCGYAVAFYGNGVDMADGNVKNFLLGGLLGEELAKKGTGLRAAQDKKAGQLLERLVDEAQEGRGYLIGCTAVTKPQAKDKEKDFTHHNWHRIEQTEAEIKARRDALDKEAAMAPSEQAVGAPVAPPPAPSAPPPPSSEFAPVVPWVKHPTAAPGTTPESRFFWSNPTLGGDNTVKSEAQLRAGQ
jgi:hypothetical protein